MSHFADDETLTHIAALDAEVLRLRNALETFIAEHEECEDADGWMAQMCSMVASIFPLLDEHNANLDKDIAELRLQCISDFGQYVDGTESMAKRLSEADKVIKMAKGALESGSDYWTNEAIAAIEDYEKGC